MSHAEAAAIAAEYNTFQHVEAVAKPFRGGWRVMVRRVAGGQWFPAPTLRKRAA